MQVTTIGLDIAKNVFQVHGIDAAEKVAVRKQLRRGQMLAFFKALPPCLIGMEACATSHYWARELTKLGHQVRLMPAKDVKAYVSGFDSAALARSCRVGRFTTRSKPLAEGPRSLSCLRFLARARAAPRPAVSIRRRRRGAIG
jgi:transposase